MPFNLISDQVYGSLIRPSLDRAGFDVKRADTSLSQRAIMNDVIEGIQTADIVVADLTGRNPNVFYELGIAHSLRKHVVMIAQSTQDIPFDVGAYRVHIYGVEVQRPPRLRDTLTKELGAVLAAAEQDQVTFTNPFVDFESAATEAPVTVDNEPGLLEQLAQLQRDQPLLGALLEEAAIAMTELGARQTAINERMESAPEGREIEHAIDVTREAAALWDDFAARFESIAERAAPLAISIERGSIAALRVAQLGKDDDQSRSFQLSIAGLAAASQRTGAMLQDFVVTVRQLSRLSDSLVSPGRRLASSLERLGAHFDRIGGLAGAVARD